VDLCVHELVYVSDVRVHECSCLLSLCLLRVFCAPVVGTFFFNFLPPAAHLAFGVRREPKKKEKSGLTAQKLYHTKDTTVV